MYNSISPGTPARHRHGSPARGSISHLRRFDVQFETDCECDASSSADDDAQKASRTNRKTLFIQQSQERRPSSDLLHQRRAPPISGGMTEQQQFASVRNRAVAIYSGHCEIAADDRRASRRRVAIAGMIDDASWKNCLRAVACANRGLVTMTPQTAAGERCSNIVAITFDSKLTDSAIVADLCAPPDPDRVDPVCRGVIYRPRPCSRDRGIGRAGVPPNQCPPRRGDRTRVSTLTSGKRRSNVAARPDIA